MFSQIFVDRLSFWIGFLAGGLFSLFVALFRSILPKLVKASRQKAQATRVSLAAGNDIRFRSDIFKYAQHQHLAAALFSLDEILVTPTLLAPPPLSNPGSEDAHLDVCSQTLPYLPDWPELGAAYGAPELGLFDALEGGTNLLLLGRPGSGKTVALAYMASRLAKQSPAAGSLSNHLPVFLHAGDLTLPYDGDEILTPLLDGLSENLSPLTIPGLGKFIKASLLSGKTLLLIDGLDELAPHEIEQVADYLKLVLNQYPGARLIAAASPDYYDGLASLGLFPVFMAAWPVNKRYDFVRQWGRLYHQHITPNSDESTANDPLLVNSWLSCADLFTTPLELTLKVWSAYAGDSIGPDPHHSFEAYLRRLSLDIQSSRPTLEILASCSLLNGSFLFDLREAEKWLQESIFPAPLPVAASPDTPPHEAGEAEHIDAAASGAPVKAGDPEPGPGQKALNSLYERGLLVRRRGGRASLIHPVISGYLAGKSLAVSGSWEPLRDQPIWAGRSLVLEGLSKWSDLTAFVEPALADNSDPTGSEKNMIWHWLGEAPVKNLRWRALAMRHIAGLLQKEGLPMGIRGRATIALARSKDPGAAVLFRQLFNHKHYSVRQLAALGAGLLRDSKAVPDLTEMTSDPAPEARRAALMALGAIASKHALDAIATVLLEGADDSRRAAAEVLALHPDEGHPALREGSTMEDMLVRKAVVYGLQRVPEPWSREILEKVQLEDKQWVVRTAAAQVIEEAQRPSPHIPHPFYPLAQTPWMIVFAGKLGVGVSPGKPAMELLYKAIRQGDPKEKMAGLEYAAIYGDETAAPHIYEVLYGCEGELQEAAFNSLWLMKSSGIPLPEPMQFGLGVLA